MVFSDLQKLGILRLSWKGRLETKRLLCSFCKWTLFSFGQFHCNHANTHCRHGCNRSKSVWPYVQSVRALVESLKISSFRLLLVTMIFVCLHGNASQVEMSCTKEVKRGNQVSFFYAMAAAAILTVACAGLFQLEQRRFLLPCIYHVLT